MHLEQKLAGFLTSLVAAILVTGCGPQTYTYNYTGPKLTFDAGGNAPACPTCFISGTFTVNSPLGFADSLNTYNLAAGQLKSFSFTISGWTFAGAAPIWSNTNGAIINQFSVSLDSNGSLGNWNIQLTSSDRTTFFATCNASTGFITEFPVPPAAEAGFPSGAACTTPAPQRDTFSGGGNTLLTGNQPGVMQ